MTPCGPLRIWARRFHILVSSMCWNSSLPMPDVWTPYCITCDKEEQGCDRGLLMLYRSCCSCFLLLLRAVRPHLDPSEVTYSRRAPTENLPFCPAYSSSFT